MLRSRIVDGTGGKDTAKVDSGYLHTILSPDPPFALQKTEPFRQFLTTDGTSSGSNDMGIDGSSTNVDFYIAADEEKDTYITTINMIIGYGSSGSPYQFADVAALTNGLKMFYTSIRGEQIIDDQIKTNTELLRLSNNSIIPTAWEVRHVGALNDYGYFISIDLRKFSPSLGIKLDAGSSQKFIITVRDSCVDADTLNAQAFGFKRFK